MLAKNACYTVDIMDLNNLGFGVARIDGITVFVGNTVTGDRAEIRIIKTAKTYAVGLLLRLLSPSPLRRPEDEVCPAARRCGGCVYQRISYEEELRIKQSNVRFAMKKAGADFVTVREVRTTGQVTGYRNKAQYPVGEDAAGHPVIGFYAAKSHRIIPAEACSLQPSIFHEIVRAVRSFCEKHQISVYREETGKGLLRHVYLRTGAATGEILLCLVLNGSRLPEEDRFVCEMQRRFPQIVSIQISENTENTNIVLGKSCRVLAGKPYIEDVLCGLRFRISPLSFYQVNHDGAELLYQTAADLLCLQKGETLLDLYCGIGTIGLSMAEKASRLIGIEIIPEAIANAKENAERNGITNAAFYCGDASDAASILAEEHLSADAVIVDPPRKGLTPEVIAYLKELAPKRIVYVSCDADTLARDLVRFASSGYHTDTVYPVDMFSRTGHVETVVLLSKLQNAEHHIEVELNLDEMDLTSAESKATYGEIQEYVKEHVGLQVSNLYIAQVKRKNGIIERLNYNLPKSENSRVPQCPPEKEKAITEALKYFQMI